MYSGKIGKLAQEKKQRRSGSVGRRPLVGLELMKKEQPRDFNKTYTAHSMNNHVTYTAKHFNKTMTITYTARHTTGKAPATTIETFAFASITCLRRCCGYVTPFTLGLSRKDTTLKTLKKNLRTKHNHKVSAFFVLWPNTFVSFKVLVD